MKSSRLVSFLWLVLVSAFLWNTEAYGQVSRSSILSDLDGDHQSDLAVSRIDRSHLNIRIHLSRSPSRLSLSTNIENQPGLQLTAYDVDNDHDIDLVLTSIFSPRPVAVWLNSNNGHFDRASSWIAGLPARDNSPAYRRAQAEIAADDALLLSDPSPVLQQDSHFYYLPGVDSHARLEPAAVVLHRHRCDIADRGPPLS